MIGAIFIVACVRGPESGSNVKAYNITTATREGASEWVACACVLPGASLLPMIRCCSGRSTLLPSPWQ